MSDAKTLEKLEKEKLNFDVKISFFNAKEKSDVIQSLKNRIYPQFDYWLTQLIEIFEKN